MEFVGEAREHIDRAESALLYLETHPGDAEAVNTVFRAFHTIKGTSSILGLASVEKLAHQAETLLDRVRNGEIRLIGGYADLALESADTLKQLVSGLGAESSEPAAVPGNFDSLLERLGDPAKAGISEEVAEETPVVPRLGDILVAKETVAREAVEEVAAKQADRLIGQALVEENAASGVDVAKGLRTQRQMAASGAGESSVRVSTHRLDGLIDAVGELVIAHAMIAQRDAVLNGADRVLSRSVSQLGKIARELQDVSLSLRMVPLKATFQRMARLVRDLARKAGKAVEFAAEGDDTEIDRNMVEAIGDPLVHLMRNAVDHGIEFPAERRAAGKPEKGTVRLRAYHRAGNVVLELSDDGRGLDKETIIAKARAKGLVGPDEMPPEEEIYKFIFAPGLSTAETVTDISGRGVGMDVVRRNIESLRGRIQISSAPGLGTTFTIRLPLTLAIIDGMLIRVGEQIYILPTLGIQQAFRPARESLFRVKGRGEIVALRDSLIPIFRLHRFFGVEGAKEDPAEAILIVLEHEGRVVALLADALIGQQQVVIKSLGAALGDVEGISGAAILGDGRVGLILDPGALTRSAIGGSRREVA